VNRFGAGNGWLLVIVAQAQLGASQVTRSWLLAATVVVAALATLWAVHRASAGRRLPTTGVVPLSLAAVPGLLGLLTLGSALPPWLRVLDLSSWPLFVELSVVATGAAACAAAFSRRGDGQMSAGIASALYVVGLAALERLSASDVLVNMTFIAMVTAAAVDLVADLRARARDRDLVEIRPLRRIDDATAAAAALAGAGIPCHLRNLAARSLYHFFAPQLPVGVLVPAARAAEAAAVVDRAIAR
jgi:hypothetical protein